MLSTIILLIFAIVFLTPAMLVAVYYAGLMLARFLGATARCPTGTGSKHDFAIVIPAHNEEDVIAETIQSCQQIDYPKSKYTIYVLADNCSDGTVELAKSFGVTCLERHDIENPGKGQALEWAFDRILPSTCEAIVVIDADCVIDNHALRVFDSCLDNGTLALQANHAVSNPDAAAISYVAAIGDVTEYDLFYAPKSDLGLSVMLVGTGMVLHRSVLEMCPWKATSVTEDVEYTLALTKLRIPIRFVSNVCIRHTSPECIEQLTTQRARWARGTLGLGRRQSLGLMIKGMFGRNLPLVDFGWTLAVLSRPLVLAHLLLTTLLAFVLFTLIPGTVSSWLLLISVIALAMQLSYFLVGILMIGMSWRRLKLLFAAPVVGCKLIWISASAALSSRDLKWEKTPR